MSKTVVPQVGDLWRIRVSWVDQHGNSFSYERLAFLLEILEEQDAYTALVNGGQSFVVRKHLVERLG